MVYSFPYFGGTPMYHTGDLEFWFYSLGNVRYQIAGDEEAAYRVAANQCEGACGEGRMLGRFSCFPVQSDWRLGFVSP